MKKEIYNDPTNPIVQAVAPLKQEAMDSAEKYARMTVESVRKMLKEAGNDLNVCAPYPSSHDGRAEYHVQLSKYKMFRALCQTRQGSHQMHEPVLADVNSNYVAKFVKEAKQDAAFQYEAYVAKLQQKIGTVTTAKLQGNAVWSYSFLVVETATGQQIWKTQIICNVSKLGKVFNQFPTRQVKEIK